MKNIIKVYGMRTALYVLVIIVAAGMVSPIQAQQRDRLAELNMECRNWAVTHTSVAPDGSLWMVCSYSEEIFWANDIHSAWKTLAKAEEGPSLNNHENITAFDRKTAVITGNMWPKDIKRTSSRGQMWDYVDYSSQKGFEWFHPAWRGEGGLLWTGSQDGLLIFSTDSGQTFTTLRDTAFDHKTGIDDIYMLSADSGWIVCHDESLYSTSDNWRTFHRQPTPSDKGVSLIRPWMNYLIVKQAGKSYYTTTDNTLQWKRMPLTLLLFEVDTATGMMWAIDDKHEVVLMEDIDKWKPMGVKALSIIGILNERLYCRVDGGVMRVGADGVVDRCPFLTDEQPMAEPEQTLMHGGRLWGYDEKSVYIKDKEGWYRVARPIDIAGLTPDPDRKDRVIVVKLEDSFGMREGGTFSIDLAGYMEPYTYRQPLATFVKSGLESMEITTYKIVGTHVRCETISYTRSGNLLAQASHTKTHKNYDPHLSNGPTTETENMTDSVVLQLSANDVEKALLLLDKRYNDYPSPRDFGLNDTALDLRKVFAKRNSSSSNRYGYTITLVNGAGDTLTASGNTSAFLDLSGSTHYPWLLPMTVQWREAIFTTYQPTLWQVLREAMPDSMQLREYLDNKKLYGNLKQ